MILESRGVGDLLEQPSFMARQAHQDARVLKLTRADRAAVSSEANRSAPGSPRSLARGGDSPAP